MIGSIVIKLFIGIIGILIFLRLTGKTQMAQMTPLDTVNGVLLGTLVGGLIFSPGASPWYLVFAIAVWTLLNIGLRFLMRWSRFRVLINGRDDLLIDGGQLNLKEFRRNNIGMDQLRAKLREMDIYSLLDVERVRFETDGEITVYKKKAAGADSFLLVNSGEIMESTLKTIKLPRTWLLGQLKKMGCDDYKEIYCAEWTPGRGFYVATMEGDIIEKPVTDDPRSKKPRRRIPQKAYHIKPAETEK